MIDGLVLNLLHCRPPFYLCFEQVDNLGAYTASRPETALLIPSDYDSCRTMMRHPLRCRSYIHCQQYVNEEEIHYKCERHREHDSIVAPTIAVAVVTSRLPSLTLARSEFECKGVICISNRTPTGEKARDNVPGQLWQSIRGPCLTYCH